MRKTIILFAVLLISTSAFSQRRTKSFMGWHLAEDPPTKLNEVKLNLGTTIFALYPEFFYERIICEDFGIGASAGISLDSDSYYPVNFAFVPFARWYFGGNITSMQKYGAGFFIETNGALLSQMIEQFSYSSSYAVGSRFGAGVGLAVGWKYLSKNNWIGEFTLGAGRDFVNDASYPRAGITLGKRF